MSNLLLANHGVFRRGKTFAPALDIRAHVGTSTSPTSTGNRAVTGVGFTPKAVLPFGTLLTSSTSATNAHLGLGGMTASVQAAISVSSMSGVTTSNTDRRHDNADAVSKLIDGTVSNEASRVSLDADGFTLNWTTVSAAANILNHICLGGADLEVSLTQHQMNSTNAAQSFAHGLSGAPTGLLFFSALRDAVPPETSSTVIFSTGFHAGAVQLTASTRSNSGVTTTATRRSLLSSGVLSLITPAFTPETQRVMSVSSVDSATVNCTYPVAFNSGQFYFWMLAIRGARCQVGTFNVNGSLSPLTINTPGITPRLFLTVLGNNFFNGANTVQNDVSLTIGASDGTRNVSCGITDVNGVTTTNARRYQNSSAIQEFSGDAHSRFVATAAFSGESVVLSPTVNVTPAVGQGGFLVIGS